MTGVSFLERLGGRLTWVREHQRIRSATRAVLADSDVQRQRVALLLNALRLEIRRRHRLERACEDGDLPDPAQGAANTEGVERC